MAKLQKISGEKAVKALVKMGFERLRQKGSHVILKKMTPNGAIGTVVPMHKELAVGTLRGILKQARVEPDEFMKFLK